LNLRIGVYTEGTHVSGWFDDLEIRKVNNTNEIIEESNYYPFGLKHKGYNNVVNSLGNSAAQIWGYQGQELNEDLGYNMHEYMFRHYDPSIGRFFAVDPLAADYVYNSTYAFQENKLGLGKELEGLELEKHEWLDKKGNNHIDYNAHFKIQNNSSASSEEVLSYIVDIGSKINSEFSGKDADGNIVETTVTFEFVDELDTDSDFGIEFVDQVMEKSPLTGEPRAAKADGKTDEIGNTQVSRMQLLIPGRSVPGPYESVKRENIGINGTHEFGHAMGLNHQSYSNKKVSFDNNIILERNNLMRTDNGKKQQVINKKQRSIMNKTYQKDKKK
ncbi:RHS repeat domain-containing protein, partial [Tenacibaculum maritimum]